MGFLSSVSGGSHIVSNTIFIDTLIEYTRMEYFAVRLYHLRWGGVGSGLALLVPPLVLYIWLMGFIYAIERSRERGSCCLSLFVLHNRRIVCVRCRLPQRERGGGSARVIQHALPSEETIQSVLSGDNDHERNIADDYRLLWVFMVVEYP